jgi:hypothetical protein
MATLDETINEATAEGLCSAATLLRFASDVLRLDTDGHSTWVALRAIDDAEKDMRGSIDQGDDINTVDARLSALRMRLSLSGIRDVIQAGRMAYSAADGDVIEHGASRASRILEAAAKACYALAWQAAAAD